MENKYIKYLLIIGVVLIWGIIVVRIINGAEQQNKQIVVIPAVQTINYEKRKDSFSLLANYPDPFIPETDSLNEDSLYKTNFTKNSATRIDSIFRKPDYSFIKYVGIIANKEKKLKIAIINFRGNDMLMKEKDKIEDFRLKKIDNEKLTFIHKGILISIEK
jgi:hypothetical protein